MTHSSPNQSCAYFPHLGPVGCLPAPNIFPSANEFAKGKMFWNYNARIAKHKTTSLIMCFFKKYFLKKQKSLFNVLKFLPCLYNAKKKIFKKQEFSFSGIFAAIKPFFFLFTAILMNNIFSHCFILWI